MTRLGVAPAGHDADCLCRGCYDARHIQCVWAWGEDPHPDHRHPECESSPPPELGITATCRTCGKPITYEVVEEHDRLPRTGWSDGFRRDALVCFSAIDYRHIPNRMYSSTPEGAQP